jgi:hypothetical protein
VLLRDSTADESASLQYTYGGYIAEVHSHLVEVGYYEGGAWELVNFRTGTRQHFDGPPIPAPDSTHLAVVSSDLEAQYVPTTIQVWRMGQDTAVLEWRLDPNGAHRSGYSTGDWGPTGAAWRSSDTILIHTEMLGEHGASASETVTVVRTKTGWALVAPPVTPN